MQDSKSLYSRCFAEYRLGEEELKKLQHELLLMLVDIKTVCDKYRIEYALNGGTALGAVRHGGFIPWDDDADIMMFRSEFDKFKKVFCSEFPGKYELAEPLYDPRYVSKAVKIFKKGTTYVEIPTAGVGGPDMIFVDLFLIENLPPEGLKRKLTAALYDTAFRAASVCVDYRWPSPPVLEKSRSNRELRRYYSFRRFLGFLFSCLGGMRFYLRICEHLADQKNESEIVSIPSDNGYLKRLYPRKLLSELTEAEFCGYRMKIPRDYDAYLTIDYGDYMQIPPPEKREVHSAVKIDFGQKSTASFPARRASPGRSAVMPQKQKKPPQNFRFTTAFLYGPIRSGRPRGSLSRELPPDGSRHRSRKAGNGPFSPPE